MSWCGVKVDKYRADIVLRRDAWHDVAAIRAQRVVAISEEFLGRPGPRLVEGYRQLRTAIAQCASRSRPAPFPAERPLRRSSAERRVGTDRVSTWRSRWSPYDYKQTRQTK